MSFAQKFWNGKINGLPGMLLLFSSSVVRNLRRRILSPLHRANFAAAGKGCRFGLRCTFQYPGRIFLGSGVSIADDVTFSSNNAEGFCRIADDVYVNSRCEIDFSGGIKIERKTTISEEVIIHTHSHGYDPRSAPQATPLTIEEGAWIGMRSIILPQVDRIGAGAIVAAGAVVSRSVPPHTIVGGNPARVIRQMENDAE